MLASLLVGAALFFEDFLTCTDDDGRVVLVPSYSPETGAAGVAAVNATMDIAAARHALSAAVEVCERLGIEKDAVPRWRDLLGRLPPYRIDERGALAEWAWPGLDPEEDHRHISHLYPVWPLHDITPGTTPGLAKAALRALRLRGDENLSAHGSLHRALAAARLRDGDLAYANLRKILGNDMVFRSLMTAHNPGLEIYNADAAHTIPAVLIEMLVDSRPGMLEVLPALPDRFARGAVRGLASRAGVGVEELAWDLRAGTARVVLRSTVDRQVTLVCRRSPSLAAGRPVDLLAGRPATVDITLGSACDP